MKQVAEHLSQCPACRDHLAELQATLDALSAPQTDVSTADVLRLQARLARRIKSPHSWFTPMLTSACVIAMFFVYLARPVEQPHQPAATSELLHNMEVIQHLEMLQSIELLEELELLEALESRG
ncbi:MAG: hypothetical protein C0624_01115 [Desulfuromonas sp.]|nr:MAG: hypothetical protein C0624_01115 [Desulfuromonas sp.]